MTSIHYGARYLEKVPNGILPAVITLRAATKAAYRNPTGPTRRFAKLPAILGAAGILGQATAEQPTATHEVLVMEFAATIKRGGC